MPKVVIAAGGTAGHVVPALAVADALRSRGAEVEFVGGERAEAELVPAGGYPLHTVRVRGIDRHNPLKAGYAVALALRATGRARRVLRSTGADVVLGGGGYVAGPVGLAARSLGLPLALTEADSHLGVTNRLLAPLARRVFLSFPIEGREGRRYAVTGRPIPRDTGGIDQAEARRRFDLPPDVPCVLVFGGSLGARRLNDAALEAFGRAAPCSILHACGRRDHADLRQRLDALGSPPHYRLLPYIEPFAAALAAADLAVARAGGPCSSWRRPASRRCWCRIRTPPPTTRPPTLASWSGRARRWWCPTRSWTARGSRARPAPCSAPSRAWPRWPRRRVRSPAPTPPIGSRRSYWKWPTRRGAR